MNCRDARNAMLLPDAGADLAAHLASCPGCALIARQSAQLDAAWAATRPAPPNFEAIWTKVESALDRPGTVPLASYETKPFWRRPRLLMSVGLAQAAAVLIAAWTLMPSTITRGDQGPQWPHLPSIEADEGQVLVFGDVPQGVKVIELEAPLSSEELDPFYDVYNRLEALAVN